MLKYYIKKIISYFSNKNRLLRRLKNIHEQVEINFLSKKLVIPNGATFSQAYKEIFEQDNYCFETTNPEPIIIDCGSNIGLSVIYFKKHHPRAKIVAFEADNNIFELLSQNLKNYNITDVELVNKAVWIEDTTLEFVLQGSLSGKILQVDDPLNTKTTKVTAIDLTKYLNQKIDFLKIDIEGAETQLLKHIAPHLDNVERIFMEYHAYSKQEQSLGEILSLLQKHGFRYQVKEAYTIDCPFVEAESVLAKRIFDLQLDIFAYKL